MRVAVLSSTMFGYCCIMNGVRQAAGVELVGVVTTPAAIDISYSDAPVKISTYVDFREQLGNTACEIAVLASSPSIADYLEPLNRWKPEVVLALGWYYMVPKAVRSAIPHGCLGIHASLLPKYRGGAPIPWAIIQGEKQTGVSLFVLEKGVDTGDILGQLPIPIEADDTCATVYGRATLASCELLRNQLALLAQGRAVFTPQDEDQASQFPQRSPADGEIDWHWDAGKVHDFVRAQTHPYPGAFTWHCNQKVSVWRTSVGPNVACGSPGQITDHAAIDSGSILVRAGRGTVAIHCASKAGEGEEESGRALANRLGLCVGQFFQNGKNR